MLVYRDCRAYREPSYLIFQQRPEQVRTQSPASSHPGGFLSANSVPHSQGNFIVITAETFVNLILSTADIFLSVECYHNQVLDFYLPAKLIEAWSNPTNKTVFNQECPGTERLNIDT